MISLVMHLTYHWQDDKAGNWNLSFSGVIYWGHSEHVLSTIHFIWLFHVFQKLISCHIFASVCLMMHRESCSHAFCETHLQTSTTVIISMIFSMTAKLLSSVYSDISWYFLSKDLCNLCTQALLWKYQHRFFFFIYSSNLISQLMAHKPLGHFHLLCFVSGQYLKNGWLSIGHLHLYLELVEVLV